MNGALLGLWLVFGVQTGPATDEATAEGSETLGVEGNEATTPVETPGTTAARTEAEESTAVTQEEPAAGSAPTVPPGHLERLIRVDLKQLADMRGAYGSTDSGEKTTRDEYATARSGAGGDLNTVTAPEDFAALIQTTLPGVKAGVLVSPFALAPSLPAATHGIHILAAGLDGDGVRFGGGYSLALPLPRALTLEDLKVEECKVHEDYVTAQAVALTDHFVHVCDEFVAAYQPEDGTENMRPVADAWDACGFNGYSDDGKPLTTTMGGLSFIEHLIEQKTKNPKAKVQPHELEDLMLAHSRAAGVAPSRAALAAFSIDRGLSCYDSDSGRKELSAAAKRYEWSHTRWRVGARYTEDRQVRLWGLNPDPTKNLSDGDLSQRRAILEGAVQHGRFELVLSGGYHGGKVEVTDGDDADVSNERVHVHGVATGASISIVLSAIDGERLFPKPRKTAGSKSTPESDEPSPLRTNDGLLPPRLAMGIDGQAVLLFDRPESQGAPWQQVQLTPFFDVLVSDKLRFRLGSPFSANTVLRTRLVDDVGVETRAEKRGLQWKASALVFTVLKL